MQTAQKRTTQKTHKTLWGASFVLWLLLLLAERLLYSDSVSCALPGEDSVYGTPGWSWIPLGHTCTWSDLGGVTVVDSPTMMTLLPPIILAVWAFAIYLSKRDVSKKL